jgi:hypothetical protein
MRRAQRDAAVHAARPAELLQIDARHQAAQAVADEIDASAADALAQEAAQADRGLLDACRAAVLVGDDLLVSAGAQIAGQGQKRTAVGEISVHQHDGALLRPPLRSPRRPPQAERVEQRSTRERENLATDDPRRALVGDGEVLRGQDVAIRQSSTAVSR